MHFLESGRLDSNRGTPVPRHREEGGERQTETRPRSAPERAAQTRSARVAVWKCGLSGREVGCHRVTTRTVTPGPDLVHDVHAEAPQIRVEKGRAGSHRALAHGVTPIPALTLLVSPLSRTYPLGRWPMVATHSPSRMGGVARRTRTTPDAGANTVRASSP